jgi:pyrroloquinoline quinone (PQQ) biosynthesis protein C
MKSPTLSRLLAVGLTLAAAYLPGRPSEANGPPPPSPGLDTCGAPGGLAEARAKARRLVRRIRADLAAVEDQIRHVPFVAAVEAGRASIEQIAAVVAEEYSIVRSDINSFGQMADRWDNPPGRHFFGDLAAGEALAMPLLLDFAANVGLDEAELAAYEPRPKSQTYPSRVAWIASNADRAAAAASLLVNFGVFGENMARIRNALIAVYRFTPQQIEFFTFFAEPIPGFEDDAIEVIAAGLVEGACPVDARRSARLLQAYELDFWQAASAPPGSPLPVVFHPGRRP